MDRAFQAAGWQGSQAGSGPRSSLGPSRGAPALAREGLDLAVPQRAPQHTSCFYCVLGRKY